MSDACEMPLQNATTKEIRDILENGEGCCCVPSACPTSPTGDSYRVAAYSAKGRVSHHSGQPGREGGAGREQAFTLRCATFRRRSI